jgi:hypothetical protein
VIIHTKPVAASSAAPRRQRNPNIRKSLTHAFFLNSRLKRAETSAKEACPLSHSHWMAHGEKPLRCRSKCAGARNILIKTRAARGRMVRAAANVRAPSVVFRADRHHPTRAVNGGT